MLAGFSVLSPVHNSYPVTIALMSLFTAILEFDGGTYISQIRSASVRSAVSKYASGLGQNKAIPGTSEKQSLAVTFRQEVPVSISGVQNVWCCSGRKFALLNIIQTAE
jgi:hypothetical protein